MTRLTSTLDPMKLEHTITAPSEGVLTEFNLRAGQQVEVGTVMARRENVARPEGDQS